MIECNEVTIKDFKMQEMKLSWKKTNEDVKSAKDIFNLIIDHAIRRGLSPQKKEAFLEIDVDCGYSDVIISTKKSKSSVLEEFKDCWDNYFEDNNFPFPARTVLTIKEIE